MLSSPASLLCTAALLLASAFTSPFAKAANAADASLPTRIALFGGSSSATTYLPKADQHHRVLHEALQTDFPGQKVEVFNLADNGEFIARYLLGGAYTAHCEQLQGKNIDIAFIRCGINDSKRFKPEEFTAQLKRFIDLLKADFPGVRIILETGFYLDYPLHYASNRNKSLNPYWQVKRDVAQELGLPLSDVYLVSEKATAEGNWDIRIRSQSENLYPKKPSRFYWETTLDEDYGKDPAWFTDVHPSPHGVRMAAATEVALLKQLYPDRLPTGGGKITVSEARPQAFFVDWIDCQPERIKLKTVNPDQLQTARKRGAIPIAQ